MKKIWLALILMQIPIYADAKGFVKDLDFNGSMSLNFRNVSPKRPGYEYQIQTQVYLSDIFFGLDEKISEKYPFLLEFQIPTASRGEINLYRFSAEMLYWQNELKLELGKFLIPFGHYNELYRADKFLTITRPLLYASPDNLDLVLRLNSPRPPFSAGYTDIGARISYYPNSYQWLPSELTFYLVNGFGEVSNRSRTFPYTGRLNVEGPPISGVNMDFGHLNNNLADNNNNKAPGGRIAFALGDLKIPFPIEEGLEFKGIRLGVSGMYGRYDLEEAILGQDYRIFGADLLFQYKNLSFTGEYVYSETDFRAAQADSNSNVDFAQNTNSLPGKMEINQGFYLQSSFPIWRSRRTDKKLLGVLAFNRLERRGPKLIYSQNTDPKSSLPVNAFPYRNYNLTTQIDKYTAGLNLQITNNLIFKTELSYWTINVPPVDNAHQTDINQFATSLVFSF